MDNQLVLSIDPKELAGRAALRENADIKNFGVIWKVPFSAILIRPGANSRIDFEELEELADNLELVGQIEPLTVDILKDGSIFLLDGERRYLSMGILYKRGSDKFIMVEVTITKPTTTELERLQIMAIKNDGRKEFKPLEQARHYARMMEETDPSTNKKLKAADVARRICKSKMHVSNRLALLELSAAELEAMKQGLVSPTAMLELTKSTTPEQRADIIKEAEETGEVVKVDDVKAGFFNEEKSQYENTINTKPHTPLDEDLIDDVFNDQDNKTMDEEEKGTSQENFMSKKPTGHSNLSMMMSESILHLKELQKQVHTIPFPMETQLIIDDLITKLGLNLKHSKKVADAINT